MSNIGEGWAYRGCAVETCPAAAAPGSKLCRAHHRSKRVEIKSERPPGQLLTDEEIAEVRRLHRLLKSNREIARTIGCTPRTVAAVLKRKPA